MTTPDPIRRDTLISKSLSYLLRHGAVKEKLKIDEAGYVKVSEILSHHRLKAHRTTLEDLKRVVENNDKKRFHITTRDKEEYICATQGHSISRVNESNMDVLTKETMPKEIYHGTYKHKLPAIFASGGISRMNRNHIHFASNISDVSGARKNCNVLIFLNIDKCLDSSIKFYKSLNNVILTDGDEKGYIPYSLFDKIVDLTTNELINMDDYIPK